MPDPAGGLASAGPVAAVALTQTWRLPPGEAPQTRSPVGL